MKNIFGKVLGIVLGMLCFCIPLWGCAMLETSDKKVSEIDFTVVSPEELPEEIRTMIDERKNEAFQMAYHDGTYSYIIVGYGQQETSGYSISVNDVYQGRTAYGWIQISSGGKIRKDGGCRNQSLCRYKN